MDNANEGMNNLDPRYIFSNVTDPNFDKDKVSQHIKDAIDVLNTSGNTTMCMQGFQAALEWTLKYIYKKYVGKLENNRDLNLADLINNAEMKQLFAGRVVDIPKQVLSVNRGANGAKHDMDTYISRTDALAAAHSVLSIMTILCDTISDLWKKYPGLYIKPGVKENKKLNNQRQPCLEAWYNSPKGFKYRDWSFTWTDGSSGKPIQTKCIFLTDEDIGKTWYCKATCSCDESDKGKPWYNIAISGKYEFDAKYEVKEVIEEHLTISDQRLPASPSEIPTEKTAQTSTAQTAAQQEKRTDPETVPKARAKAETELERRPNQHLREKQTQHPWNRTQRSPIKGFCSDDSTKDEQILECTTAIQQSDRRSKIAFSKRILIVALAALVVLILSVIQYKYQIIRIQSASVAAQRGTLVESDGIYEGELKDGVKHGYGTFTWTSSDKYEKYEGEWDNGAISGQGTMYYVNGDTYTGAFSSNNTRAGWGVYKWSCGDEYEGDWVNDSMFGKGVFRWADGKIYEGDWANGVRSGQGKEKYANGDVYEGEWVNDKRSGYGIYTWTSGSFYEGNWDNGYPTGQGQRTYADGSVYEGSFLNGKREGYGKYTAADGTVLQEGQWSEDEFIG